MAYGCGVWCGVHIPRVCGVVCGVLPGALCYVLCVVCVCGVNVWCVWCGVW